MGAIIGGKMQTLMVQAAYHQYVQKIVFSLNPTPEKLEKNILLKPTLTSLLNYFQVRPGLA